MSRESDTGNMVTAGTGDVYVSDHQCCGYKWSQWNYGGDKRENEARRDVKKENRIR